MAVIFNHRRTVAIAAVPEDSPNTVPPPDAKIFRLDKRIANGDKLTTGHTIFFEFLDAAGNPVSGPVVTWQTWFRDDQNDVWPNAEIVADGAAAYDAYITEDIRNADLYVQILGVATPGTATHVVIRVAEV